MVRPGDDELMHRAIDAGAQVRSRTAPRPWVGAALSTADGDIHTGATQPPGGDHAVVEVLRAAGGTAVGATLATTLEPCADGPASCTDAIIGAGVARVLVAVLDADPIASGAAVDRLRSAGLTVEVGAGAESADEQLAAYLHHRRTGRPYVVLRLASSLDGRIAAPNGESEWITGIETRTDVHRMRAESQAILVGAGTVRADNPSLDVRLVDGPNPRRVVLGSAPPDAKVHPCLEWVGPIPELLEQLGDDGVLQLLVEGGAGVASEFHDAGLVDRYVVYMAPAIFGGDDAHPAFIGSGAPTIADLRRGRFVSTTQLGADLRLDVVLD